MTSSTRADSNTFSMVDFEINYIYLRNKDTKLKQKKTPLIKGVFYSVFEIVLYLLFNTTLLLFLSILRYLKSGVIEKSEFLK